MEHLDLVEAALRWNSGYWSQWLGMAIIFLSTFYPLCYYRCPNFSPCPPVSAQYPPTGWDMEGNSEQVSLSSAVTQVLPPSVAEAVPRHRCCGLPPQRRPAVPGGGVTTAKRVYVNLKL